MRYLLPVAAFGALTVGLVTPPLTASACPTCGCQDAAVAETPAVTGDIVDIAIGAGSFETLVAAVQAADLVEALKGEGPFTVLAPTDEAFAKLPEGVLESLLLPENKEQLQQILLYHVVAANATSDVVSGLTEVETLQGQKITIEIHEDHIHLNGASHVISADVMATNGVIHVIDTVLLPPAMTEAD